MRHTPGHPKATGWRKTKSLILETLLTTFAIGVFAGYAGAEESTVGIPGCHPRLPPASLNSCVKDLHLDEQLPDLLPYPTDYVDIGPTESLTQALRFDATFANHGSYALDIVGEPTLDSERRRALQCIRWANKLCIARRDAGELIWHDAHGHWHFEGFALYELRSFTAAGEPDYSDEGIVSTSGKVSFCLQDYKSVGSSEPPFYPYRQCSALLQGISPGWADVYVHSLPGQNLNISEVPDGQYALVFTVDPDNRLAETNDANSVAYRRIELAEGGTRAWIIE